MHERNCCAQCLQRHVKLDWSWEWYFSSINCGRINHVLFISTYLHALIKQLETALNYFCIQYQFILLHYTACTEHTYCSTISVYLITYNLVRISVVYENLLSIVCACMDNQVQTAIPWPYRKSVLPTTFYNCRTNNYYQHLRFVANQQLPEMVANS